MSDQYSMADSGSGCDDDGVAVSSGLCDSGGVDGREQLRAGSIVHRIGLK